MGFGLSVKVEVPKVEVPKVDVAAAAKSATSAVSGAVDSAKGAVSGAVDSAKGAVTGAVDSAKGAVNGAVGAATAAANSAVSVATKAVASLTTVAGAIADVAVSFTGAIEDIALEPHLSLDANASFGKTKFEKGPIWIRIDMKPDEAKISTHILHVFSESGDYDEKKKNGDFTENDEETISVLFDNAPMNETYSLEVILEDGDIHKILDNVSYGEIRNSKQGYL